MRLHQITFEVAYLFGFFSITRSPLVPDGVVRAPHKDIEAIKNYDGTRIPLLCSEQRVSCISAGIQAGETETIAFEFSEQRLL
jgi:hypothetical protein